MKNLLPLIALILIIAFLSCSDNNEREVSSNDIQFLQDDEISAFINYNMQVEIKCCDPAHVPPCVRTCKCYLISAELEQLLSDDLLHEFTISEIDDVNEILVNLKKPYYSQIGNTYTYELNNLAPLQFGSTYLITVKPIIDGEIMTYTIEAITY